MTKFAFFSVYYEATNKKAARCKVTWTDGLSMIYEQNSWEALFRLIKRTYPNAAFTIPDEIEVITYDTEYRRVHDHDGRGT